MEIDRTFRDVNGIEWHVSHVMPATPASAQDEGWLSFVAGRFERRLSPVPETWHHATIQRLEQMCRVAKPIQRDETAGLSRSGLSGAPVAESTVDTTPAEGSDVVDVPGLNDHMSVLANTYPVRENRITYRG